MKATEERGHLRERVEPRREMHGRAAYRPFARRLDRAREAVIDRAERRIRDARRMARRGRFAMEDGLDSVALRVRRNPAAAIAIAFAAGAGAALAASLLLRVRRPRE